ncbi:unannotated protein [freshwater metagenome]|uniref:Unannotated protein n=1 Tax=freshwater metagenome TaxID=449393 RepID=A0A6J7EM97_9ZZZZ
MSHGPEWSKRMYASHSAILAKWLVLGGPERQVGIDQL